MYEKEKSIINEYINLAGKYTKKILIILIANVNGLTPKCDDYDGTSVISEYYTMEEFENISISVKKMGFEVVSFFSEKDFIKSILNNEINTLNKQFLIMNSAQTGTFIGRKSLIPSFCESYGFMHTGSNPYVVSLCRNKFHTSAILNQLLSTKLSVYLYDSCKGWLDNQKPEDKKKVICKLNSESASIGLTKDNIFYYSLQQESYIQSLSEKYKQSIVVQDFIEGYEVELPVLLGTTDFALISAGISFNDEPFIGNNILDYNARFYHKYNFYDYDNFQPAISYELKSLALSAAQILGIEGFGRIDFRINSDGTPFISDIATNPHITKDSSFAFAFKVLGYNYIELLAALIGSTLFKYNMASDL